MRHFQVKLDNLLPEKTFLKYYLMCNIFMKWMAENKAPPNFENVLLQSNFKKQQFNNFQIKILVTCI